MLAKKPKVAQASHRRRVSVDLRQLVFFVDAAAVQEGIDLADLEAAELETDFGRELQDLGQLDRERLAVPRGILSDPIEREPERPQLGLGQIGNTDCRHLGETQLPCCQHEPPARNDALLGVDQDRQDEAEPIEARRELAHLLRRMLAGLATQGHQACERD